MNQRHAELLPSGRNAAIAAANTIKVRTIVRIAVERKQISGRIDRSALRLDKDVRIGFARRASAHSLRGKTSLPSPGSMRDRIRDRPRFPSESTAKPESRARARPDGRTANVHAGSGVIGRRRELVGRCSGRHDVVVDSSVLVVHDQQRRVRPQFRIVLDRVDKSPAMKTSPACTLWSGCWSLAISSPLSPS